MQHFNEYSLARLPSATNLVRLIFAYSLNAKGDLSCERDDPYMFAYFSIMKTQS